MQLGYHLGTDQDVALLARMNKHLIEDEGHSNPMTLMQLEGRMRGWLVTEQFTAVIFSLLPPDALPMPVAYILFREEPVHIYVRHFFVARAHRRNGLGRAAFDLLRAEVLPADKPLILDVLAANQPGYAFWQALGFEAVAVRMVLSPAGTGE